jgi:hypothetical protein
MAALLEREFTLATLTGLRRLEKAVAQRRRHYEFECACSSACSISILNRCGFCPGHFFFAIPSAEQGVSLEQLSPITPTACISISMPGRAKFVTVMRALPG